MAVAESGEVMPPKSTWFEPKLADGLVSPTCSIKFKRLRRSQTAPLSLNVTQT